MTETNMSNLFESFTGKKIQCIKKEKTEYYMDLWTFSTESISLKWDLYHDYDFFKIGCMDLIEHIDEVLFPL
jgi:hypothetical protein